MIRAEFAKQFTGFTLSGHALYADEGQDIVCAAVSAMTNLVCNAAESFGAVAEIRMDAEDGFLSYRLCERKPEAVRLLHVFHDELKQLEEQYPENVRVTQI